MAEANSDLAGLAQLHRVDDVDQVRALWRRGMATLAAVASEYQPVPLEGFSPSALLAGTRIALNSGLFDDLDWLSPAAAAAAMFELAAALPRSDERRMLGRRVLTALHHGDAQTFITLATSLALGTNRGLSGPHIRARVALSMYMPLGLGTQADALALALISRRDSEREWLIEPSMGSLPSRRLAARLLERAAREAARRATEGDHSGVHVFGKPSVSTSFHRLLADRESLVWRHVAAARGLLSSAMPAYMSVIERNLAAELTPTEWRRAAASLTARIAVDPEETMARCSQLLYSDLAERDRGVISSMILGLPCAAEAEPAVAEELLDSLISAGDIFAVEALVDLRRERIGTEFGERAAVRARALLLEDDDTDDDGHEALKEALHDELAPRNERGGSDIHDWLVAALRAFAEGGARAAQTATEGALEAAAEAVMRLERADDDTPEGRKQAFLALRELDRGLLETNTLNDLLTLRAAGGVAVAPLESIRSRMTHWLLDHESEPVLVGDIEHVTWRLRRLRALLHLLDADDTFVSLRDRRLRAMSALLSRVNEDVPSPLRRTVCAALARVCDAVVRKEICELSDVFIAATLNVTSDADLAIIGEASMQPVLKELLREYVDLVRGVEIAQHEASDPDLGACLEALRQVADSVPTAESPRIEALRSALHRFERALAAVQASSSLSTLTDDTSRIGNLEASTQWLAQLVAGASRRLERGQSMEPPRSGAALRALDAAVERASRGERKGLGMAVATAVKILRLELPPALAEIAALVLWRIRSLPATTSGRDTEDQAAAPVDEQPRRVPWLPPGRVLGGFYILRTIGKGAVGSVFVARRVEERHDDSAEVFALKVPEYHGAAAHTLSEAEFHQLFREEARALLMLPEHRNLARFVTFDVGARPKPILVMELVKGPTLERVLDRGEFNVAAGMAMLDGIAAGLEAMHRVGVAHLDVKPSNIILRDLQSGETTPVLVDFGLAGRKLRPGCATVHYGAPEVWSTRIRPDLEPMPTDVYAFSCLAFEVLTNEILFDGDTAVSIVSSHLEHEGKPDTLLELGQKPGLAPLAKVLTMGLCAQPKERVPIGELRARLAELTPTLARMPWPLGAE
jgi:eukaryotic-like serine/threonine-protein kinase